MKPSRTNQLRRFHNMPFGAECRKDGSVRFRLWAPAAQRVELCIDGASAGADMGRPDNGWFEFTTSGGGPGALYSYRIDGGQQVPDPASRFQPKDIHGPSEVIAPDHFDWRDDAWRGRRWEEAVIYEFHVGAFTELGTFLSATERLDYLADLGVTALEMMPVSDFAGRRNWGYDGVLPYAPDSSYGRPDDLKQFIQSAHQRGMMVLLDVVYNHFGPEGNYLGLYAPQFFTDKHPTPWGNGINFDGPESRVVRDFFIHNALYWLTEYHFDGLRLDAVHAIADDTKPDILTELAETVRETIPQDRYVHLILENDRNQSRYLQRDSNHKPHTFTAQWNDDIHHALHVLVTGERDGYYLDYAENSLQQLGRCLVEGFAYQGEVSTFRNGTVRGESTNGVPLGAFISFLQNHDQIGNRAFGERITKLADERAVRAAMAILLVAPSPPMLFMGEEFGADEPFLFFCDFHGGLAAAVTNGRRNEFAKFAQFSNPTERDLIPDPNAILTFERSKLNWNAVREPGHQEHLSFYRRLLHLRSRYVVPKMADGCVAKAGYAISPTQVLRAQWTFTDQSHLVLLANLNDAAAEESCPGSQLIYHTNETTAVEPYDGHLPAWSVAWFLQS